MRAPSPPSCVQVPHRGVRNQGLLDSCAGGRGRLRRARAASLCRHCQPCQPQQLSPHPTPHSGRRFNMKSDRSDGSHPTANSTANPRQFTANQRKTTSSNSPINANQRKFSANRRKPTPFGRQQTPFGRSTTRRCSGLRSRGSGCSLGPARPGRPCRPESSSCWPPCPPSGGPGR